MYVTCGDRFENLDKHIGMLSKCFTMNKICTLLLIKGKNI